jgi:hypothetical protein
VVVVTVMAMMNHDDYLRLRRIGDCEAEDENEAEQNLFHA